MIKDKIDLVVSFDTTGSMYPVLAQVRRNVEQFVKDMFNEFTDLRLSIIAHGDYCDARTTYTIKVLDFTNNDDELCKFVRNVGATYGGDADECYELVLNTAHSKLHWREDAVKLLIMIGDAAPHGVNYAQNVDKLDWIEETNKLAAESIKVFAVHALARYRSSSRAFYKTIAEKTFGTYLTLDNFNEIIELIKATCYQQGGNEKLSEYIEIIKAENKMTNSLDANFRRLMGEVVEEVFESTSYSSRSSYRSSSTRKSGTTAGSIKVLADLEPVPSGRFQTFKVDKDTDIRGFVESMGITFKKGRGFYELTKAVTVQQYKEIILQDRETGEMYVGKQVREKLGLQPQTESGGVNEKLHAKALTDYRVFIQSTSVNRKLIGGTMFLYEVEDIADTGTVIEATVAETKKTEVEVKKPSKFEGSEADLIVAEGKSAPVCHKTKKKKAEEPTKTKLEEPVVEKMLEAEEKAEKAMVETVKKVAYDKKKKTTTKKVDVDTKKDDVDTKAKKTSKVEKTTESLNKQIKVVEDALSRYAVSTNKKNTQFLKNNLSKLSKLVTELNELV